MSTSLNVAQWSTTAADNSNSDAGLPVMSDTMDPIGLDNVPRGMMAALAKWRKDVGGAIEAGGTANALTATSSSGYEAAHLVDGLMVVVRAASANTNATVTLNVDSTGAKGIKRADGSALAVGSIKAGHILILFYNADNSEWWAANIAPASSALSDLVSSITPTDGVFLVGNGTTFVGESGATARTSLGLGSAATQSTGTSGANVPLLNGANTWSSSQTFSAGATVGDGSGDVVVVKGTTVHSFSSGLLDNTSASDWRSDLGLGSLATASSVNNGNWSGTDLAVANGGTGASDASGARSNLGLGTAALKNTGTSGDAVPLLNAANTFTGTQTISGTPSALGMLYLNRADAAGGNAVMTFAAAASSVGNITFTDAGPAGVDGVQYNTTSDGRLKTDAAPIEDSGEIIDRLNPVRFTWRRSGARDFGFVAQEVDAVVPGVVVKGSAEGPDEDGFQPWSMQHGRMESIAFAELKSLRRRVARLEGLTP